MSEQNNKILDDLINKLELIKPEEIPNIDLYMDQVTTFIDKHLGRSKRNTEDKILTKTMINNYTKNDLLPPPEKKKYSKEHILILIYIYYFKNIMGFNDIKNILDPITSRYFHNNDDIKLEDIYRQTCSLQKVQSEYTKKSILDMIRVSEKPFSDKDEEDNGENEFLKVFSLITSLTLDIYTKKQMIESIVDSLKPPADKDKKNK